MDCTTRLRPRLSVQPLEDRSVPALLLSDVGYSGVFFNSPTEQFFELRGDPGATISGRTYLVTVAGDAGTGAGVINSVFDLGGVQLGSSGYLAVVQANSPYTVDSRSAVLRGTTTGFGGLGGTTPDRFSDNSALSNEFEFIFGSNTFLLITANTAPVAGADVDVNDDGLLDSAASTWTVLDSVGVLGPTLAANANEKSYGKITVSQGGVGVARYSSVTINATAHGHVARVGESTGYTAADWVAGRPDDTGNGPGQYRYENGIFGRPTDPNHFTAGLRVDQLGGANFVSAAYGRVYTDANGNNTFDAGDTPVAGQTVWADQNANGVLDSYETDFSIATSGLAVNTDLTNAVPGATLTYINTGVNQVGRSIQVIDTVFNTSQRIGANIVGFFAGFEQLRVDFYRPSSSVSLDYFDDVPGTGAGGTGRMEAYAADGTLLDVVLVPVQRGTTGGTMTISRPQADIAYVIAYTDPSTTANAYFDNLRFITPESSGTTAADGSYKVGGLLNGDYSIRTIGGSQLPASITNLVPVRGLDFGTGGGIGGGGGGVGGRGRTVAVGGGPGAVSVYGSINGQLSQASVVNFPVLFPDAPFDGTYRTATGDVNGDGVEDVAVVTGPGSSVRWAVIDGRTGNTLLVPPTVAFAGSDSFTGGGFVSIGDLDGDGRGEVVLTPDQGGGARVTIFSVYNVGARVRANYLGINDPNFRGGARTALGDVNGDGRADLLVAAGFQGGPRVALYDGAKVFTAGLVRLTSDFFAFDPSLRNGVFASIGDVDGDGYGDLVLGAGSGGAPAVRVLSGRTLVLGGGPGAALASPISDFFVNGDSSSRTGVRVTTKNVDGDGRSDIITGSGENQPSFMRVYAGSSVRGRSEPAVIQDIDPFGVALTEGVFVG
ncbi:MAG: VCBS repeat-containing protein [Gemmataceae bacterium]